MEYIDEINRLLAEIGWRYGIANLRLDTDGTAGIRLKDATELHMQYHAARSSLYVFTPLMPIPTDSSLQSRLFRQMLEFNCLETGTGFGMIAIDRRHERIILQAVVAAVGLQLAALDRALHGVADARSMVMQRLDEKMRAGSPFKHDDAKHPASAILAATTSRRKNAA